MTHFDVLVCSVMDSYAINSNATSETRCLFEKATQLTAYTLDSSTKSNYKRSWNMFAVFEK